MNSHVNKNIPSQRVKVQHVGAMNEPSGRADLDSPSQFNDPMRGQPTHKIVQRANCVTIDLVVTPTTGLVLPQNPNRSYLFIRNKSFLDVFVNFGTEAGNGIGERISAGGFFEPTYVPINSVFLFSSGNASVFIMEGSPTIL